MIECIIDRNTIKHDMFSPGSNIKIISYENGIKKILKDKIFLLLAWNFTKEIIKDVKKSGYKGRVIIPLPTNIKII